MKVQTNFGATPSTDEMRIVIQDALHAEEFKVSSNEDGNITVKDEHGRTYEIQLWEVK